MFGMFETLKTNVFFRYTKLSVLSRVEQSFLETENENLKKKLIIHLKKTIRNLEKT